MCVYVYCFYGLLVIYKLYLFQMKNKTALNNEDFSLVLVFVIKIYKWWAYNDWFFVV